MHDGNDKVEAINVTTSTNNADENQNKFDGDLSVSAGVLALAHANLTVATGKIGHVIVPVTFKGDTVMVDIPVYAGQSEAPATAGVSATMNALDPQTKDDVFTNATDKQKMDKQGKIEKCEWTPDGGSAKEVNCAAWGVTILDDATADKIRVVVPAQTPKGTLKVTVSNNEPAKAPNTGTHTVNVR